MKLETCERCGFLVVVERHACEVLRSLAQPTEQTSPAHAEGADPDVQNALCSLGELATLIRAGQEVVREKETTPASMLGEAYELLERARVLALNAYDRLPATMLGRESGVVRFGDARQWVSWLKREADEASRGR